MIGQAPIGSRSKLGVMWAQEQYMLRRPGTTERGPSSWLRTVPSGGKSGRCREPGLGGWEREENNQAERESTTRRRDTRKQGAADNSLNEAGRGMPGRKQGEQEAAQAAEAQV